MLDYKLIEAYATVIQEGGFDKAAQKLFLTQSAVSQRIKLLEEQFGQVVLLRSSPPQPTEFGRKILGLYNKVSRLEDDLSLSSEGEDDAGFTRLPVGLNEDTLATWFFQAIRPFLLKNKVVLDLMVEDQDRTHKFLKDGRVFGCVSTRKTAIQGCRVEYLGDIEYGIFCSHSFAEQWFPNGFELSAVKKAPMITFNRKDELNKKIIRKAFGKMPTHYATYYVPSSELFLDFIKDGLAYGALPSQQSSIPLQKKLIMELCPAYRIAASLYWHCWNLDSEVLQGFSDQIIKGFRKIVG